MKDFMDHSLLFGCAVITLLVYPLLWWWADQRFYRTEQKLVELSSAVDNNLRAANGRLMALEGAFGNEVSRWTRSFDGVFLSASPAFVRLFCMPVGYATNDIVGRKIGELTRFPSALQKILSDMDIEVIRRGHAARTRVPIGNNVKATIVKFLQSTPATGELVYIAYAVPEEEAGDPSPEVPSPVSQG